MYTRIQGISGQGKVGRIDMKPTTTDQGSTLPARRAVELNQRASESALALGPSTIDPEIALVGGDIPQAARDQAEAFHRLYLSHSAERLQSLQSMYAELGRPENLIIMLFCDDYFPLFMNWLLSCERNGIDPRGRLIAFCLDDESANKAQAAGIKIYNLQSESCAPAGRSRAFGDQAFRDTMMYKNAVILDALQLGAAVLFQDTDLIWFKDPFDYLENNKEDYDI